MESISKLLKDPTWWFTAVFIGILASLFASYLRDTISALTARFSTTIKAKRERRLAHEQRRIQTMIYHPELFVVEHIKGVVIFLCFLFLSGMLISLLVLIATVMQKENHLSVLPLAITGVLLSFMCMWVGFDAVTEALFLRRARREHYAKLRKSGQPAGEAHHKV